ncbi:MAG: hypothetical protein ACR2NW_06860 [Thermodesulfobacteriota bacterium]
MIRNSLYLFLVLMLVITPVSQAAHALTHISDIDEQNLIAQVDDNHEHENEELNIDIDKICPDCIALTAFNDFAAILDFSFHPKVIRNQLSSYIFRFIPEDFSSDYYPRAPPLL